MKEHALKEPLKKALKSKQKSFAWFHREYVRKSSYAGKTGYKHMLLMLGGREKMKPDIEKIIEFFLEKTAKEKEHVLRQPLIKALKRRERSFAWFYREYVDVNVEHITYKDMVEMIDGDKNPVPDLERIIETFLSKRLESPLKIPLKNALRVKERDLFWFYREYVENVSGESYETMEKMLDGYVDFDPRVKEIINKFVKKTWDKKEHPLKEFLRKALNESAIQRDFSWFYREYVKLEIGITYQYMMSMLKGNQRLRQDVERIIETFLKKQK